MLQYTAGFLSTDIHKIGHDTGFQNTGLCVPRTEQRTPPRKLNNSSHRSNLSIGFGYLGSKEVTSMCLIPEVSVTSTT
jgi:hypothetical protein